MSTATTPASATAAGAVTGAEGPMAAVRLDGVSKVFAQAQGAEVHALDGVSLAIAPGEFLCLLGGSGCGKSTMLRIVAGFERPTAGTVSVGGKAVRGPGPDRGVVFQDYGLFPWLSAADNVAFGLKRRKVPKDQVDATVERFLGMVGLARFADRYPAQLSGGMQQRVAIARVLANDPAVLLMDEPFGALDALTRETMQNELQIICDQLRTTVVFVTHSVEEAVFLGDRVVVMGGGPSTGQPGHVDDVVTVGLDHPREVTSPEFNDIKRRLLSRIHASGAR